VHHAVVHAAACNHIQGCRQTEKGCGRGKLDRERCKTWNGPSLRLHCKALVQGCACMDRQLCITCCCSKTRRPHALRWLQLTGQVCDHSARLQSSFSLSLRMCMCTLRKSATQNPFSKHSFCISQVVPAMAGGA